MRGWEETDVGKETERDRETGERGAPSQLPVSIQPCPMLAPLVIPSYMSQYVPFWVMLVCAVSVGYHQSILMNSDMYM